MRAIFNQAVRANQGCLSEASSNPLTPGDRTQNSKEGEENKRKNCIEGYRIILSSKVYQNVKPQVKIPVGQFESYQQAIKKLLEKGAIEKCEESADKFVSSYFLILKPDGRGVPQAFRKWQSTYPWLDLNSNSRAICKLCTEATQKKLPLAKNSQTVIGQSTWVEDGFDTWKNAVLRFMKHEKSELHREALTGIVNLSKPTVVSSLSHGKKKEMADARIALEKMFNTVNVLARQGLALRGWDNDENSNLIQLLKMRAEDVPQLEAWLKRTSYKWLHHDSVNEILEIMAEDLIQKLLRKIKSVAYFALIADETADITKVEQVSISIRIVLDDLSIEQIFMGFYATSNTRVETLFKIMKNVLLRFNLNIANLRGQCYDGASNVSGRLTGLQARIHEEEPRALHAHCSAHTTNLVAQNAMEAVKWAINFIGVIKELINFIRDSPKSGRVQTSPNRRLT
ncbi:zinc finger MYM-type protein 1-like [Neodiprion fabricii]|uniref:zinc finger MYM-type protein 1-like n=1 Tax=Neodiprion fabricii TaxID=2872261 RepID=UPI001ED92DD4|nr:zinc finger MYM-type protein 1-like [Neodiprion fabricii]